MSTANCDYAPPASSSKLNNLLDLGSVSWLEVIFWSGMERASPSAVDMLGFLNVLMKRDGKQTERCVRGRDDEERPGGDEDERRGEEARGRGGEGVLAAAWTRSSHRALGTIQNSLRARTPPLPSGHGHGQRDTHTHTCPPQLALSAASTMIHRFALPLDPIQRWP